MGAVVQRLRGAWAALLLVGLLLALTACAGYGEPYADLRERTASLRGLDFREPFEMRSIERDDLAAAIQREIETQMEPAYLREYAEAYTALGVLPAGTDLMEEWIGLQTSQIVGYYSMRERALYDQHATQMMELTRGLRHNDDFVAGLAAVIEGDAALTMFAASDNGNWPGLEAADELRDMLWAETRNPSNPDLVGTPRLLLYALHFPYAFGIVTAADRHVAEGRAGLDRLLAEPPLSTRSVLVPDQASGVEFIELPIEDLRPRLAARGCEPGHHNVAGALTLQVLFEEHGNGSGIAELIEAWRGDRFLHIRCGDRSELLWLLSWSDAPAAEQFAKLYREIAPDVAARAPLSGPPRVEVIGRTTLISSPGLASDRPLLEAGAQIRHYDTLAEWIQDDCFTESPCPTLH